MKNALKNLFNRNAAAPEESSTERFRDETIRLLKAGTRPCAGDVKSNVAYVTQVAEAGNRKLLLAVHRCLDKHHSVEDIIIASNELREFGYTNHEELLTQRSLTARRRVMVAMAAAGATTPDVTRVGALVTYRPEREQHVMSLITEHGCTDSKAILDIVEERESQN